jgi:uncharacterized protein DUF4124
LLYQLSYAGGGAKYTDSMTRFGWFLVMALVPALAGAEAYRWVDEKGQVHYSQVPPPGKKAEPVAPAAGPAAAPNQESLNKSLTESKAAEGQRQQDADRAFQQQANRDAQCNQAREQLAYMDAKTSRRLGTTDEQGNVSRVTEEQFQARRAELQQILNNC